MELSELRQSLKNLDGATFIWQKQQFEVTGVKFSGVIRRYCVFTKGSGVSAGRSFVFDHSEKFSAWLHEIKLLDGPETKSEYKPHKINNMDAETSTAVATASQNVDKVTTGLLDAFNAIVANPSEDNIKKGHALSGIANTMVNVGKLHLDLLKLKNA